ncbi:MAG: LysM peptidoglycan-binding domain-containing protein [Clostridium thermopalmarium]|uniref:LysM peptidoglycan-binding domain-containing protein n=1 Tax=Clostridium thermopalmarium TaxID=29373 RepID=UPI002351FC83|nr:LysM peptidoglycan-binding domain-containing protein [Clostridium thermopalmarium]MBE6043459.1 LysM peptidoglycan-binding domain-containing protein [Clostridium thermopalmarium]
MNSKIKKTLIIISSSVVLFLTVFFMARSLNNLIDGSDKENVISVEDTSSSNKNDNNINIDTSEDTTSHNKQNNNVSLNIEESKTTNNNSVERYIDYTVQEGDTLFSIARKTMPWKGQEDAVKTLETINNIKNRELLTVGSKLMIPVNNIDTSNCTKYIVQKGDTLYTIAEEYLPNIEINSAVNLIMSKNNISNPSALSVGLEIYIPNSESSTVNSNSIDNNSSNNMENEANSPNTSEDKDTE